ncbi:acyltransferase family protein [Sunxiuqinia sp. A32]|uniref:acyltransferase family protein n=1 Tax=Sunxiuqinia sp. A32 TaxID=3461496 RepID=UPI0040453992
MEKNEFTQSRLLSLDFFRGITMLLLIAEFTHLFDCLVAPELKTTIIYSIGMQFHHHPWNGLRFWDLIQPFFMFIVGVAMPLSYAKRIKKGETHQHIFRHILKRSLLLLILGWALYCIPEGRITFFFQNVLAQLSVTILIAFLIMRKSITTQIITSIALIALSELVYRTFWIEGFTQPFTPDHNFGAWFDLLISGELSGGHWVSINAIPTTAHTIWGVLAGKLLMSNKTNQQKLYILIIAGLTTLIIGYGLNPVIPIIKRIATSSFVFASGGWTLLALTLSYWLIDMLNLKKGVLFFAVVGMNPLFIYLFAHVGGAQLINEIVTPFTFSAFNWAGELWVHFLTTLASTFSLWYICYRMYKQKIYIKI